MPQLDQCWNVEQQRRNSHSSALEITEIFAPDCSAFICGDEFRVRVVSLFWGETVIRRDISITACHR